MNYIIFNDKDSRTINGLMICTLAPITKPRMRVQETSIDGVDGSIIEYLGYEPYEKEIEIGLKGNFDIDEIIKFFDGSGKIIFSNEPTKYYNANIIEQIDYEKLLRFRTAKIKILVQPYKYKNGEVMQQFDSPNGNSLCVVNEGLESSNPYIYIKGSGTIEFRQENMTIFHYTFPTGDTEVVIDSTLQDAYWNGVLKNRNMVGDFPKLKSGQNNIVVSGNISTLKISPNSRWL